MLEFIKAECAANAYIYVFSKPWQARFIAAACNEKTGIGADGVVFIQKTDGFFCLDIYNSDGSRADFCGNACLTVAKILAGGVSGRFRFNVKTLAQVVSASHFNGVSEIVCKKAEVNELNEKTRDLLLSLQNHKKIKAARVFNAGNLHLTIYADCLEKTFTDKIVKKVLRSGAFENGINIEFFKPCAGENRVNAVVFERGSGYTLACGSGALATFEAYNSFVRESDRLTVEYVGGRLTVERENEKIKLSGEPHLIFKGGFCDDFLAGNL